MSRHIKAENHNISENTIIYYLKCLAEEEASLLASEKDIQKYILLINKHKHRAEKIKMALGALGGGATKPESS